MDFEKEYRQTLDWLYNQLPMFSRIGAPAYKPGLETTIELDRLLQNPHLNFKSVHVGGTNGKGSTSHMIAAVLQSQGYKTGLYTSPHLTDFRERMRIDGEMIPQKEVTDFIKKWQATGSELKPSFFELTMMMAFDWFSREKVDIAVIEVGMGGRLDSTNIITPLLSVITNISFDHTQFLGDTLEKIAIEKAGIIKPGVPVAIGEAEGEIKDIFCEKAINENSPIYFAQEETEAYRLARTVANDWKLTTPDGMEIIVPLKGGYQDKNIRTAICALKILRNNGLEIDDKAFAGGLSNAPKLTGLRGRWEVLREKPKVICDTGHNLAGISENMKTLSMLYPGRKVRFVLGFVSDKDVAHIVNLFPLDGIYYFTKAALPRAMKAEDVALHFSGNGLHGTVVADVASAYRKAVEEAEEDDIIYIGGSTFVVADLLESLHK